MAQELFPKKCTPTKEDPCVGVRSMSALKSLIGKTFNLWGPNCFAAVFYEAGLIDHFRGVSIEEIQLFIHSNWCHLSDPKASNENQLNIGALFSSGGDAVNVDHVFTVLSFFYAFQKDGPNTNEPFSFVNFRIDSYLRMLNSTRARKEFYTCDVNAITQSRRELATRNPSYAQALQVTRSSGIILESALMGKPVSKAQVDRELTHLFTLKNNLCTYHKSAENKQIDSNQNVILRPDAQEERLWRLLYLEMYKIMSGLTSFSSMSPASFAIKFTNHCN